MCAECAVVQSQQACLLLELSSRVEVIITLQALELLEDPQEVEVTITLMQLERCSNNQGRVERTITLAWPLPHTFLLSNVCLLSS